MMIDLIQTMNFYYQYDDIVVVSIDLAFHLNLDYFF